MLKTKKRSLLLTIGTVLAVLFGMLGGMFLASAGVLANNQVFADAYVSGEYDGSTTLDENTMLLQNYIVYKILVYK